MDTIDESQPSTSGIALRQRPPRKDSSEDICPAELPITLPDDIYDAEKESLMDHKELEFNKKAEELLHKVWEGVQSWTVLPFHALPKWLQDNDYLHDWHRPPLPSFSACFKSIFRVHTETGNIWTHLLGCIAFIGVTLYFMLHPETEFENAIVFIFFLAGAILCLAFSTAFHTLSCHSEFVAKMSSKLDYCGIATLIMGSFVPWLYYGFYCDTRPKVIYMSCVVVLGVSTIIVSLWDKFSTPRYRALRTSVFLVFGLSGIIPAVHYGMREGLEKAMSRAALGPLALMGSLYVLGALFYAVRVPERWFPGKCDLIIHSHQIFHILVVAAAFVHYHGISSMAQHRAAHGQCREQETPLPPTLQPTDHI